MVMAGLKKSKPGNMSKVIILFKMIRLKDSVRMEIPTYDSHAVKIHEPGVDENTIW